MSHKWILTDTVTVSRFGFEWAAAPIDDTGAVEVSCLQGKKWIAWGTFKSISEAARAIGESFGKGTRHGPGFWRLCDASFKPLDGAPVRIVEAESPFGRKPEPAPAAAPPPPAGDRGVSLRAAIQALQASDPSALIALIQSAKRPG